jgi:nitrite reductase/ring-hydroxylating ferredoxin subunit
VVAGEWHIAARVADIEPGEAMAVTLGKKEYALFRILDEFFATDNRCTHAAAPAQYCFLRVHCDFSKPLSRFSMCMQQR